MNKLMSITVDEAKKSFFNRMAVKRGVDLKKRKVLSKFGAFVRQRARSSMRASRQKSMAEMTQEEIINFEQRKRLAQENGGPKPRRPTASSKPGEPPRVITGLLKRFLFFVYDATHGSVVIGPAALNRKTNTAPAALEYGGYFEKYGHRMWVEPRPYMNPAFDAEVDRMPPLWAGALSGN